MTAARNPDEEDVDRRQGTFDRTVKSPIFQFVLMGLLGTLTWQTQQVVARLERLETNSVSMQTSVALLTQDNARLNAVKSQRDAELSDIRQQLSTMMSRVVTLEVSHRR